LPGTKIKKLPGQANRRYYKRGDSKTLRTEQARRKQRLRESDCRGKDSCHKKPGSVFKKPVNNHAFAFVFLLAVMISLVNEKTRFTSLYPRSERSRLTPLVINEKPP